jgi:hypothetical protein
MQPYVTVVGQRRIGKTSLLFRLADPVIHTEHGLSPAEYVFVYLDGEELTELDSGQVRGVMVEELAVALWGPVSFPACAAWLGSWM